MATNATETIQTSSTDALSKLSGKEYNKFMLDGELPEEPKESKLAESSTPAKAEVAAPPPAKETVVPEPAKAEASTESAPVATEPPKPEKGAESRVKELLSERKQLLSKIEELEKRPVAPTTAKKDEVPAKPQRTDLDDKGLPKYATDADYEEARDEWVFKKASEETRKQIAKEQEDARLAERQKLVADKWLNGMQLARTKYADLDTVLKTDDKGTIQHEEIKGGIKSGSVLDGWLVDSEIPFDLLYHFAKTPGEVAKIQAMTPFAATRYLTRLEDKLSSSESKTPTKAEEVPPAKSVVSKAPAPATSVSGKATAPVDEVERAVKSGDAAAYFEAANREDLQKAKTRK